MELFFVRHGIAEEAAADATDEARALTEEGISKMQAAAKGMKKLGVRPDLLLSSPLVRARQTADIVATILGSTVTETPILSPGCDLQDIMRLLAENRAAQQVMLVGHEPDLSIIVGALTGGSRVEMKKGSMALVDMAVLSHGGGTLTWLLPPKILRALGK